MVKFNLFLLICFILTLKFADAQYVGYKDALRNQKLKEDSLDIIISKKQDSISSFQEAIINRERMLKQQKEIYEAQLGEKEASARIDHLIIIIGLSVFLITIILLVIMMHNFFRQKKDILLLKAENEELKNQMNKLKNNAGI